MRLDKLRTKIPNSSSALDGRNLPALGFALFWRKMQGSHPRGGLSEVLRVSIPNIITLGRVILVPVVFWLLITNQLKAAFLAFVLAGVSDAVDGFLAKRFNWETELGAYLDPLADKLLIVCIFIALGVTGKLPPWIVIAVVSRDVLIVMAVVLSWLLGHPPQMRPLAISKANTTAQLVLAAAVLADDAFASNQLQGPIFVLVWVTGFLTIASLAAYLRIWLRHMSLYESTGSKS